MLRTGSGIVVDPLSHILRLFCYSARPQWDQFGRLCKYGTHSIADQDSLADRFGPEIWDRLKGKRILDYGCGFGPDVIECAKHSIDIIGIEIRDHVLQKARQNAERAGVKVEFRSVENCIDLEGVFDYVLSINCFEHYMDVPSVLRHMRWFMRPNAVALVYFGPPWLHPFGAHLRPVTTLPWAHLLFPENTVMHVVSDYSDGKVKSYAEAAGGMNRMTIRKFLRSVAESPLSLHSVEFLPIRGLWPLIALGGVREFFTAAVRAYLVPRTQS